MDGFHQAYWARGGANAVSLHRLALFRSRPEHVRLIGTDSSGNNAHNNRQLQLALQHLEFYLEWVECSAFPRPERGVSGSETPHVPTNTPAEVC